MEEDEREEKDADHEEGDDDDVDEVEDGDVGPVVVDGTVVHLVGVDRNVQNTGGRR